MFGTSHWPTSTKPMPCTASWTCYTNAWPACPGPPCWTAWPDHAAAPDHPVPDPAQDHAAVPDCPAPEPAQNRPVVPDHPAPEPAQHRPVVPDHPAPEPAQDRPVVPDHPAREPAQVNPGAPDHPAPEPAQDHPGAPDHPAPEPVQDRQAATTIIDHPVHDTKLIYPTEEAVLNKPAAVPMNDLVVEIEFDRDSDHEMVGKSIIRIIEVHLTGQDWVTHELAKHISTGSVNGLVVRHHFNIRTNVDCFQLNPQRTSYSLTQRD